MDAPFALAQGGANERSDVSGGCLGGAGHRGQTIRLRFDDRQNTALTRSRKRRDALHNLVIPMKVGIQISRGTLAKANGRI